MPLVPAECTACGGLLKVNNEERLGVCQFCGKPFVIEEAIQTFNNYYNTIYNTTHNYSDGTIVNIYEDKSKDFVIEAGVLKEYHGVSADVVIPDGVVELAYRCFACLRIKSVVIPDSVTSIDSYAFAACESLTSITIPKSVRNIGEGAFDGCTNLTDVVLGNGIKNINKNVFRGTPYYAKFITEQESKKQRIEAIGIAPTIDEARKLAFENLNAPADAEVMCEVIEFPKKKSLGLFGGADAKVRAYYDVIE